MISLINWMSDDVKYCIWFRKWFPETVFEGLDKLVACYIYSCATLAVPVNEQSLEVFIKYELTATLVRLKFNDPTLSIDMIDYAVPGAAAKAAAVIGKALIARVESLLKVPRGLSFKADVITTLHNVREEKIKQAYSQATKQLLMAYSEQVVERSKLDLKVIDSRYSLACVEDLDIVTGDVSPKQDDDRREFLMKSDLKCIDLNYGGFMSRTTYALVGSPGTGKTRFACGCVIYNALINKYNVLFDSLEMPKGDVYDMLTAIHITHLYKDISIPDATMRYKDKMSIQEQAIYSSAYSDLFESGKYGKLFLSGRDTTLSNIEANIKEACDMNNVKVYVLDYAGYLEAGDNPDYKRLLSYEIIEKLYKKVLDLCKIKNFMAFIINQFNTTGTNTTLRGNRVGAGEIQGGAAVEKYSEFTMYFTASEDQGDSLRTLSCAKSRLGSKFKPVTLRCNLAVSNFKEVSNV